MKTISHLVAVSNHFVIGVNNDLPWNLRADLAHFKKYTLNKIIIMGRKTYESIGRPLPNRINYVVSRTLNEIPGVHIFNNLEDAILNAEKEIIEKKLSVRDVEKSTSKYKNIRKKNNEKDPNILDLEKELSDKIGLKTAIHFNDSGSSGSLTLFYSDLNQLDDIMKRLKK